MDGRGCVLCRRPLVSQLAFVRAGERLQAYSSGSGADEDCKT